MIDLKQPDKQQNISLGDGVRSIITSRGDSVLIDETDWLKVAGYTWMTHNKACGLKYAETTVCVDGKDKTLAIHRLIMDAPVGTLIDHVNGNGMDNRRENLRFCTHSQNMQNMKAGNRCGNTSGFKGVFWHKKGNKWRVIIGKNLKRYDGGRLFNSPIEAAIRYNEMAIELFGEFARLNIIPQEAVA